MAEGGRRAATTHLATAPTESTEPMEPTAQTGPTESRARPHEAATTVTTTVEQRVSANRVTGHHAWDRVCVNSVAAKLNQQNRNAGRVEWSSGAVEQPSQAVEQPSGAAERQTSGRAATSKRRADRSATTARGDGTATDK